jgi:protein-disulfide isomerase
MGSIALFIMKTYCLFCFATYALSLITILGVVNLLKPEIRERLAQFKPVWLLPILLIPIGSWLTHSIIMDQLGGKKLPLIIQESVLEWQNNPSHTFDYTTGVTYGDSVESAKHMIVEFVDLFCPHCKFASSPLKAFIKSRSDVTLLVKLFPIDGSCNSAINKSGDGFRCKWSSVVVCANQKGQGTKTLNWIFDRQAYLAQMSFDAGLKDLLDSNAELNASELNECINSERTLKTIQSMADEGKKAGIKGTPSIFLNTRQLPRGQLIPVLEAAVKSF